jgi:hypothetical protein
MFVRNVGVCVPTSPRGVTTHNINTDIVAVAVHLGALNTCSLLKAKEQNLISNLFSSLNFTNVVDILAVLFHETRLVQ